MVINTTQGAQAVTDSFPSIKYMMNNICAYHDGRSEGRS
jgi:hypothetical protein